MRATSQDTQDTSIAGSTRSRSDADETNPSLKFGHAFFMLPVATAPAHTPSVSRPSQATLKHAPFRQKREYPVGTRLQSLLVYAEALLADYPRGGVALPPEVGLKEWLGTNLMLFYNKASYFFGPLKDLCECERMTVTSKYEYLWADGRTIRRPINIPASDYIEYTMAWIEAYFDDESFFPEREGAKRPSNYLEFIKAAFRKIFRIFGHMETMHREELVRLDIADEHDRTFQHFCAFAKAYKLLDKSMLRPINRVMERWKAERHSATTNKQR